MEKCSWCKKKSHILIDCRCSCIFCVRCIQPEIHDCSVIEDTRKIFKDRVNNISQKNSLKSKKMEYI